MARFGSFKFGTGVKFGSTVTGHLTWAVEIDWDRDTFFDGSNEARRMFSIVVNRGRKNMLRATGQGFQTIPPGTCVIKLRNNDGRYDGWNQSSPLYPYVTYGPEVRIRVRTQSDKVQRDFFAGTITDIKTFGYGGDSYVEIKIEDNSRFLRSYRSRTAIAQGLTPGQAIESILDDVNWPTRWGRNIDVGTGTINYHWASGNKLAWSELEDVGQSFLGLFYINAAGQAIFIDRNTEPTVALDLTQAVLQKDIQNPQPFVNRRNVTRLKTHPRKETSAGEVIYRVDGDPILIEAGRTRTIFANYTYNNVPVPAKDVIQPVATTDYLANTNSDGSGTDKTADCTITITDFGDNAKMEIENTSLSNFYLTTRQIRGTAIYEENVDDVTYPEDPSSVTEPREFVLDLKWQQSVNVAEDYARVLGDFIDSLHPFPIVRIEARPDIQFDMDLFEVVSLDLQKLGIVGESFRVGGLEHRSLDDNCQSVETKLYLEPYITSGDYWTWPILDFGVDTIFGVG